MVAVLAACGGSDDDGDKNNQGNQGNPGAVVDGTGSNSGTGGTAGGTGGATATTTAMYKAYGRTDPLAKMDSPQSVTVPVNAGGNILGNVSIGNVSGNLTPTVDGGYVPTGGFNSVLTRGPGAIQLCGSNQQPLFVLLPPDAVLAKASELVGQTFNAYETCKQNSRTKLAFNADGTATLTEPGEKMSISKVDVAKLMGSGLSDEDGLTAFRTYKLKNGQYVLIEQGTGDGGRVILWARN